MLAWPYRRDAIKIEERCYYDNKYGYKVYFHTDNTGTECRVFYTINDDGICAIGGLKYRKLYFNRDRDDGWRNLRTDPMFKTMDFEKDIIPIIINYLNMEASFFEHGLLEGELMPEKKTEAALANLEEKYPSNSQSRKKKADTKQLTSVVTGETGIRKKEDKKFINKSAIKSNARKVWVFVTRDVIFPTIRDAVSEIVKGGIDIILYPEGSPRGRSAGSRGDKNHIRYDKMSRSAPRKSRYGYESERSDRWRRPANKFDDIGYERRSDALNVLDGLIEVASATNYASVADMKDLSGMPSSYIDNGFGWDEIMLVKTDVMLDRGEYILTLPEPIAIPED